MKSVETADGVLSHQSLRRARGSGRQDLGLKVGQSCCSAGKREKGPLPSACPTPTSWETDPGALKVMVLSQRRRSLWEAVMGNPDCFHPAPPSLSGHQHGLGDLG